MYRNVRTSRLLSVSLASVAVFALAGCSTDDRDPLTASLVVEESFDDYSCPARAYDDACMYYSAHFGGVSIGESRGGNVTLRNRTDETLELIYYVNVRTMQRESDTTHAVIAHEGEFHVFGSLEPGDISSGTYFFEIPDVEGLKVNEEPLEGLIDIYIIEAGNADRFDVPGARQ